MFDVDTIEPYGPYVLVRRQPTDEKTKSGIALPDQQIEKNMKCTVLKVGHGEWVRDTFVHSGLETNDVVIVRQFDGKKLGIDREVLLVHHEMIEAKVLQEPWPTQEGNHGNRGGEGLSKV